MVRCAASVLMLHRDIWQGQCLLWAAPHLQCLGSACFGLRLTCRSMRACVSVHKLGGLPKGVARWRVMWRQGKAET